MALSIASLNLVLSGSILGSKFCRHHDSGFLRKSLYPFDEGSPNFVQSPPGPRKVGIPLSTEIPAPTRAMV